MLTKLVKKPLRKTFNSTPTPKFHMARLKTVASLLAIGIVIALSNTLISSAVVAAQDSGNSEASLAEPYIIIFGSDGRPMYSPDASPYVFYTDEGNVTIRLKVGMPSEDSWLIFGNSVTSVYFNASWEKDKNIVLYTGESDPLFFDLNVPCGNQSIEVYATGTIHVLYSVFKDNHFAYNSYNTVYGNSTNSFNFTVARNPTPTPLPTQETFSTLADAVILGISGVLVITVLLLYFKKRKH
jgi:hypothetical protein